MNEEQMLNSMTEEELLSYMAIIEDCTIAIENEYARERKQLLKRNKS